MFASDVIMAQNVMLSISTVIYHKFSHDPTSCMFNGENVSFMFEKEIQRKVGWLVVLGLTALWDSISVYIRQSPREQEKEEKMTDKWKNVQTTPNSTSKKRRHLCRYRWGDSLWATSSTSTEFANTTISTARISPIVFWWTLLLVYVRRIHLSF